MRAKPIKEMTLEEMLETYRDAKAELVPMLDHLKGLEKAIKSHMLETGEVADVPGIQATIRNGYTRISWDSKKLQGYMAAHPEIEDFCKVTEIGPTVSIKVG